MFLPRQTPPVSRVAFTATINAPVGLWSAPARQSDATITLSGGKGGGGGGDNPASCAVSCQYCAPNQRCSFSSSCQQRYGTQFPFGCYYQ